MLDFASQPVSVVQKMSSTDPAHIVFALADWNPYWSLIQSPSPGPGTLCLPSVFPPSPSTCRHWSGRLGEFVLSAGAEVISTGAILHMWRATHTLEDTATSDTAAMADEVAVRYFTAEGGKKAACSPIMKFVNNRSSYGNVKAGGRREGAGLRPPDGGG